jgi:hypothetical protein
VVVAVSAVGVVQVAVHQVIDVIPMGHRLMTAVHSVNVRFIVRGTIVALCACVGICRADLDVVVVHMSAVVVMQMTIVKIACVAIVFHSRVTAIRAVLVAMRSRMLLMGMRHSFSFRNSPSPATLVWRWANLDTSADSSIDQVTY